LDHLSTCLRFLSLSKMHDSPQRVPNLANRSCAISPGRPINCPLKNSDEEVEKLRRDW
jgi:hypothetical protein